MGDDAMQIFKGFCPVSPVGCKTVRRMYKENMNGVKVLCVRVSQFGKANKCIRIKYITFRISIRIRFLWWAMKETGW